MSVVYRCDRCKVVMEPSQQGMKRISVPTGRGLSSDSLDLCPDCVGDFEYFWTNVVRERQG